MSEALFPDQAAWFELPAGRVLDALVAEALGWRWLAGELSPKSNPGVDFRALMPPIALAEGCYVLKARCLVPCDRTGNDGRYPLYQFWDQIGYTDAEDVPRSGFPKWSTSWAQAGALLDAAPAMGAGWAVIHHTASVAGVVDYWRASMEHELEQVVLGAAYAPTGPLAICRAFLRFAVYKGLLP